MQGSIINRLAEASAQPAPFVGMPATVCLYSDRSVGIVVEVSPSGKTIKVADVKATRVDDRGMSDWQTYEYGGEPVDATRAAAWSLRKNGRWAKVGTPAQGGDGLVLGYWAEYHDFSF